MQNPQLNYAKVLDRKNNIVSKHSKGIEFLMRKNKVDVIKGNARLLGGGRIEVQGATGRRRWRQRISFSPPVRKRACCPGYSRTANLILTNIEILDLPAVPKTIGIIGAGAVGVEFASIFNRFGSKVTLLEMLPRLVPVEDEEISKELEKHFKKTGIRTETGAKRGEHSQERKQRQRLTRDAGKRQQRRNGVR